MPIALSKKLIALTLLFFSVFITLLPVCAQASAVSVDINLSANNVAAGSEVEVRILMTSREPANAFDVTLKYSPEIFELSRASTQRSIVSFWKSLPLEDKEGVIRFIGGMIEPFSGKNGEIITLVFRTRDFGSADFAIKKADFALADGKGTLVRAGEARSGVIVAERGQLASSDLKPSAPQISEAIVTKDSATSNPIILIKTLDDGGVKEILVRSRSWFLWSDWQKAQLTASIPKYAWAIQLKAFNWEGKEAETIVYRWHIMALKFLAILAALAVLWYIVRRFAKKRVVIALAIILAGIAFSGTANAAVISLSPASGTFHVGGTFEAQILLDTEGESVNALDMHLLFPPDKLQVVSSGAGKSIVDIWTSTPRFDNQQGKISLSGGIPNGTLVNKGLIATIVFRVRQVGSAAVRFSDDTRILLNDGKGTDTLRKTQGAVYQIVLPAPAGPIVASETHPDQTQWHAVSDVILRWTALSAVGGYSYILDNSPMTVPDNIVDSTKDSVFYKDLSSGTHYFHIKAQNSDNAWGGITHFAINIDINPPAKFPIEVQTSQRTTSRNVVFSFSTTDAHSGIDKYEYQIIPLQPASVEQGSFFFVETQSPQAMNLDIGTYDIIVRAYDKTGNFQESQARVRIMTPFVFWATNKYLLGGLLLLVILFAVIARRIYVRHREIEKKRDQKEMPDSVQKKLKDLDKYQKKYGALVLLILILFGSLLFVPQVSAQSSELAPPIITTAPQHISNEEIFYLGGTAGLPNAKIIIYIQNLSTGEIFSYSETAGEKGEWFYRHPSFLSEGKYMIWVQSMLGDMVSPPSPQINVRVVSTAIQFGASRLSYEMFYLLCALILLVALLGLLAFIVFHAKSGRKKRKMLMKEIREAERAVKSGFDKLRHDIKVELAVIKRAKLSKELSREEEKKEKHLLKDLKAIERHISKEVEDVERAA